MQKAKLELPVNQFHQLHNLLGEVLDYSMLEDSEIELIEDIRHELFNQIPDEATPTERDEATYAWTTAKNATGITSIKMYEVQEFSDSGLGFYIISDRGSKIFCIKKGCAHLDGEKNKNWNFTTITND